jgi:Glycosyl hydrolases family 16
MTSIPIPRVTAFGSLLGLLAAGVLGFAACGNNSSSGSGPTEAGVDGENGGSSGSSSGGVSGGGSGSSGSSSGGGSGSSSGGGTGSSSGGSVDAGSPEPYGNIPGSWTLAFDDEFNESSLNTDVWTTMQGGGWGSTTCETANVSVTGGNLVLLLASASSGGCVCTGSSCAPAFGGSFSTGQGSYNLPVGGYTEARVNFAGSGMSIDNWPAWWTSGPGWPAGGENDIAEGLGQLTITYHSPSGSHPQGSPTGNWASSFHVYGLYRMSGSAQVYYDGQMVASYTTDDNGDPQSLFFDVMDGYGTALYGAGSQMLVDYVRAWQ